MRRGARSRREHLDCFPSSAQAPRRKGPAISQRPGCVSGPPRLGAERSCAPVPCGGWLNGLLGASHDYRRVVTTALTRFRRRETGNRPVQLIQTRTGSQFHREGHGAVDLHHERGVTGAQPVVALCGSNSFSPAMTTITYVSAAGAA